MCANVCVYQTHEYGYLCVRVLLYGNAIIKGEAQTEVVNVSPAHARGRRRRFEEDSVKLFRILGGCKVGRQGKTKSERTEGVGGGMGGTLQRFFVILPCIFLPSHASPLFSIPSCTRSSGYPSAVSCL